jgi:hypothetical protein
MMKCWEWHHALATYSIEEKLQRGFQLATYSIEEKLQRGFQLATYSIEEKLQRGFQLAQIAFIGNGTLLRSPYLDESVLFSSFFFSSS